jgi:hypothetical protein
MGVRRDRIEELDLHADDRTQADVLGRRGKSDRPIEALVVCQRQGAEAQLGRSLGQVLYG